MTRLHAVEHEIKKMDKVALAAFRSWFLKYDAAAWDYKIEADVRSGKLANVAREALKSHLSGKSISV